MMNHSSTRVQMTTESAENTAENINDRDFVPLIG